MFAMDTWPRERVLSLAPDRASVRAATALAGTRAWLGVGYRFQSPLGIMCWRQCADLPDSCRSRFAPGVRMQLPEPEGAVQARARPAPAVE